jgi:hypothetical protein
MKPTAINSDETVSQSRKKRGAQGRLRIEKLGLTVVAEELRWNRNQLPGLRNYRGEGTVKRIAESYQLIFADRKAD